MPTGVNKGEEKQKKIEAALAAFAGGNGEFLFFISISF
jgi:hypothetical protein